MLLATPKMEKSRKDSERGVKGAIVVVVVVVIVIVVLVVVAREENRKE